MDFTRKGAGKGALTEGQGVKAIKCLKVENQKQGYCGLKEKCHTWAHIFEYLVPSWWQSLAGWRKHITEVGFEGL